jgi:hypothetical protein
MILVAVVASEMKPQCADVARVNGHVSDHVKYILSRLEKRIQTAAGSVRVPQGAAIALTMLRDCRVRKARLQRSGWPIPQQSPRRRS